MASDTSLCTWKLSQEGDGSLVFNALRSQAVTELALSFDGKAALLSSNVNLSRFEARTLRALAKRALPKNYFNITKLSDGTYNLKNILHFAEISAQNQNSNSVTFVSVTATSTNGTAYDTSKARDGNEDTYFCSKHMNNDVQLTRHQTVMFTMRDDVNGLSVIRIINRLDADLDRMVNVRVSVVLGAWTWSTFITTAAPSYTIHVPTPSNVYREGLVFRDVVSDTKIKVVNGVLRPYVSNQDWMNDGVPRYSDILDSALATAPRGPALPSPPTATNRVVFLKRPERMDVFSEQNVINIAEVDFFDVSGSLVTPGVAWATSNSGNAPPANATDNNVDTFVQTRLGDPRELSNDQYLSIILPSSVTWLSRIRIISRLDCCSHRMIGIKVMVSVGGKYWETAIISDPDIITIPIPLDGEYPNGLASRDYYSGIIYYHENGVRRMVSKDVHAASGYFPFYQIADSKFYELPLGPNLAPVASTDNFIVLYKTIHGFEFDEANVLHLAEISVFDSKNVKVSIPATSVYFSSMQRPTSQDRVVDGSSTSFTETRRLSKDPQLLKDQIIYIRLPSDPLLLVSRVVLMNRQDKFQERMMGVRVVVQCNQQHYETKLMTASKQYTLNPLQHTPVLAASPPFARHYGIIVKGEFRGAAKEFVANATIEQCAQRCDYRVGCAGYSIDSSVAHGCHLLLNSLGVLTVASNQTSVLATNDITNVSLTRQVREQRIYLYRPRITLSSSTNTFWTGPVTDCALECDNTYGCIAYVISATKSGGCYFISSFSATATDVPGFHAFIALLPIQNLLNSAVDGIGKYVCLLNTYKQLKFVSKYGTALSVGGEDLFVGTEASSVNYLSFEAEASGKYLCRGTLNDLVLGHPDPLNPLPCEWALERIKNSENFHVRSAMQDGTYISHETYTAAPMLVQTPTAMALVILNRGRISLPFTKGYNFRYEVSQDIKDFTGPVSLCASECEKLTNCVGYTVYESKLGCSLKSKLSGRTSEFSSDTTYEVDVFTQILTNQLPWQLRMALLGGRSRTPTTGMGVHVHLIDSGVTTGLGDRGFFNDWNFPGSPNWADTIGHADVIAKIFRYDTGIVPGATIHNLKVIGSTGTASPRAFVQAVADVMQKATNNFVEPYATRPTIISLSVVFPNDQNVKCIVQMAYTKNIYVVAAAGNDDVNADNFSPANSGYALVVGAYEKDLQYRFSNYGYRLDVYAGSSDFNGTNGKELHGTSLAAPQAAAVLAKLLHERPEFQNLPPIYAFNILRAAGLANVMRGDREPGRVLTDRSRLASAFTNKKLTPRSDFCQGNSIKQIVASASSSLTGKAVASALSVSALQPLVQMFLDAYQDDENAF